MNARGANSDPQGGDNSVKDSFREEEFFRMVQKICETCGKAIQFSGYIAAQVLHEGGRFICMPCRRKARGGKVGDRLPIHGV